METDWALVARNVAIQGGIALAVNASEGKGAALSYFGNAAGGIVGNTLRGQLEFNGSAAQAQLEQDLASVPPNLADSILNDSRLTNDDKMKMLSQYAASMKAMSPAEQVAVEEDLSPSASTGDNSPRAKIDGSTNEVVGGQSPQGNNEPVPTSKVASGDTLEQIARNRYGSEWRAGLALMLASNNIKANSNGSPLIYPGQELNTPSLSSLTGDQLDTLSGLGGDVIANNAKGMAAYEARQAQLEANKYTGAAMPDAGTQAPAAATGATPVLAEGQAEMRSYWTEAQDNAVKEGSFVKYLGAGIMRTLGDVGYGLAGMGVAVANSPDGALVGAGKAIVNFGPEGFNGAVNGVKTALDGYTMLAELAGVPRGTFDSFRQTDAYNITPLLHYNGQAEQGGALLANLGMAFGMAKYGARELQFQKPVELLGPGEFGSSPIKNIKSPIVFKADVSETISEGIFVETGSGSAYYRPTDSLGRPTGIDASITSDMINTGTPANHAITPPGWAGNGTLHNQARGHLLGNQLGDRAILLRIW